MTHSHCTGPGTGTELGMRGFYVMLCTVHTAPGLGTGMEAGNDGFHTHFYHREWYRECSFNGFCIMPAALLFFVIFKCRLFPVAMACTRKIVTKRNKQRKERKLCRLFIIFLDPRRIVAEGLVLCR